MSLQFYRDEAARQRSAGDASPLQNVRERCERAALALDALAIRSERADAARVKAASEKLWAESSASPDPGPASPVRRDS